MLVTVTSPQSPPSAAAPPPAVRARGVVAGYDGPAVLHGVDLTVGAGEVVALLGANGSGKSTLVKVVTGLLAPRQGSVELFGTPRRDFREHSRVGYVPQRLSATGGVPATVAEVVRSGLVSGRRLRPPRDAADRVARALAAVGLDELARRPVAALSGGQQQRVIVARALVREPDLLVLDEPVAGVDLPSQEAFARALDVVVGQGRSVLVVLHELGPLAPLIDRAVVLRGGHVVHDGVPPEPTGHHAHPEHDHVHPHADPAHADGEGWLR